MRMVRIIGIGTRMRGDDGVGPFVIDELRARDALLGDLIISEGDGSSLIELWRGWDRVIVVDSFVSGAQPGSVHTWDVMARELPLESMQTSSHHFGLADAVGLSRRLGILPGHLLVCGIEGEQFDVGSGLSPSVRRSIDDLVMTIISMVRSGSFMSESMEPLTAGDVRQETINQKNN